jgi:hypothetical protein
MFKQGAEEAFTATQNFVANKVGFYIKCNFSNIYDLFGLQ